MPSPTPTPPGTPTQVFVRFVGERPEGIECQIGCDGEENAPPKTRAAMPRRCDLIIPPEIAHDLKEVSRNKIAAENAARNAAARVVEFVEWRGKKVELNEFLRRAENAEGDERRVMLDALSRFNPFNTPKPAACPKCGPLNDVLFANDEWHGTYCYCQHCGRRGPDGNKSVNEAVAAWNRRAEKGTDHA